MLWKQDIRTNTTNVSDQPCGVILNEVRDLAVYD